MSNLRFTETMPVKLPEGTSARLAEIAKRTYESRCSVARRAIMQLIEQEERRVKAA